MRVVLSTYGSRGGVEPMAGLVVQSRALPRAAESVAAQFDTVAAAAEEGAAPVATGMLPTGGWR
jgi:hypothetical protein